MLIAKLFTCPAPPNTTTGEWLIRKLFVAKVACAPYSALPPPGKAHGPNIICPARVLEPHGPVTTASADAVAGSTSRQNTANTNFLRSKVLIQTSLLDGRVLA